MKNIEIQNKMAEELDMRIANHISMGNLTALNIIIDNHMDEVQKIRDYMLGFLEDINNPWALNQYFHMAVAELKINLADLLTPTTKIVSEKEENIRLAM